MAHSMPLSSTEKENQSFGNERDHFEGFGCRSTEIFSLSSSAMLATSLVATHTSQVPTAWIQFAQALSAPAISKQITHNTGSRDVWIY